MNFVADTHTHSLACDHAYSTIPENAAVAADRGLRFLCLTEHSPSMPGAPTQLHFSNMRRIPVEMNGVILLKGVEVNILDKGTLDLPDHLLERLDWVIASFHLPNYTPASREEHTGVWLSVAENPLVDVVGHCGDGRYPFDEKKVIKAFARNGKIVEINAHSFQARPGSRENCPRIARLCMEEGIPIVVSSDAHYCGDVGAFGPAVEMLEEIGYPEELILNGNFDRFLAVAKEKAMANTREYLQSL